MFETEIRIFFFHSFGRFGHSDIGVLIQVDLFGGCNQRLGELVSKLFELVLTKRVVRFMLTIF